jgi:hypothetical protein
MAIATGTDAVWYASWTPSDTSPTVSGNMTVVGSDANRLLLAFVTYDTSLTISSVVADTAGTNEALALIGGISNTASQRVEIWGRLAPTAFASKGIAVTFTGSGKMTVSGATFRGVDQGALATSCLFGSANGTGTSAARNVGTAPGNATVSVCCDNKVATCSNPGSVQTTIEISNAVIDSGAGYTLSAGTDDQHTWTYGSSVPWAIGTVLIYAAGASGASPLPVILGHYRQRRS